MNKIAIFITVIIGAYILFGCPPKVVVCALTFVWLGFNRFCGFATAKVVVRL